MDYTSRSECSLGEGYICILQERRSLKISCNQGQYQAITAILVPVHKRRDQLIWHCSRTGLYGVKSDYQIAYDLVKREAIIIFQTSQVLCGRLFGDWRLPKKKSEISSGEYVETDLQPRRIFFSRNCAQNLLCPICSNCVETTEHLLIGCDLTRAVWFG